MNRLSTKRVAVIAAAAMAVAAFALVVPLAGGAESSTLDLSAPVSKDSCRPCHAQIGDSRNPDVIFSHASHLTIDCTACHVEPPHENRAKRVPPMSGCFACHGLVHGEQGVIATEACTDCHPADFTFRPDSHVEDWAATPHADASRDSVNACMLCHWSPADCDQCHQQQAPEVAPIPPIYLRTVGVPAERDPVVIDVEAESTMGQCVFCHPDIDSHGDPDLIFAHNDHLMRDYRCAACHPVFPHSQTGTERPDMASCYRCHSLTHAAQGEVATEDCLACHPVDFELIPPDHTPAFIERDHRDPATEDVAYCILCHTSSFCSDCHRGEVQDDGTVVGEVIPADHDTPEWMGQHGALYLAQEGACSICHTSESCERCHQTPMPHPTIWLARHSAGNGYPKEDCYVCHTDRSRCQECHHDSVRGTQLIRENCVNCHDEMRNPEPTTIKVAGLAEHAVHFDVEEAVGRPYVCDDCHIGFTIAGHIARPMGVPTGTHDLRLCYDCHGALDFRNVLIAPYPGAELCRRCHTDLNI